MENKEIQERLKALSIEVEFFDIEIFENEIMGVPYQIENIINSYANLTKEQKVKFESLIVRLKEEADKAVPKCNIHRKILEMIQESIVLAFKKIR